MGPKKCMMINHSGTGGCDLYSKDCTCATDTDKEKHVVSFYLDTSPTKDALVTIDASTGKVSIDSSGFPDAVG